MRLQLPDILPQPPRPAHLGKYAHWLSGEGAGSWFEIEATPESGIFLVTRYSPEGKMECTGQFNALEYFDLNAPSSITYPSHCARVTLKQDGQIIILENMDRDA